MHYIVNDPLAGNLVEIAHAMDGIAVVVPRIRVWHVYARSGYVATEELFAGGFVGDNDAVGLSARDSRPGKFDGGSVEPA